MISGQHDGILPRVLVIFIEHASKKVIIPSPVQNLSQP